MTGAKLLSEFIAFLNEREVPYRVVGLFSSNYHGIPRSTKDADIFRQLDERAWNELSRDLPEGMELDPQGGFEMVTAIRKELISTPGSLFEIEVFHLSEDEFAQERFRRRVCIDLGEGVETWIASAKDVVIQKLRWVKKIARSTDFDDVVSVLKRQKGGLDYGYIESWCSRQDSPFFLTKARSVAEE